MSRETQLLLDARIMPSGSAKQRTIGTEITVNCTVKTRTLSKDGRLCQIRGKSKFMTSPSHAPNAECGAALKAVPKSIQDHRHDEIGNRRQEEDREGQMSGLFDYIGLTCQFSKADGRNDGCCLHFDQADIAKTGNGKTPNLWQLDAPEDFECAHAAGHRCLNLAFGN